MKRVLRNVKKFDSPKHAITLEAHWYKISICAVAFYKHPAGLRPCGLQIFKGTNGEWLATGWVALEGTDDAYTGEAEIFDGPAKGYEG